jgi:hypothetical protein
MHWIGTEGELFWIMKIDKCVDPIRGVHFPTAELHWLLKIHKLIFDLLVVIYYYKILVFSIKNRHSFQVLSWQVTSVMVLDDYYDIHELNIQLRWIACYKPALAISRAMLYNIIYL